MNPVVSSSLYRPRVHSVRLCAAAGLLMFAFLARGQVDTGSITGQVTDPSGAVVPNATVKLLNEATQLEQASSTDDSGKYTFSPVRIGTYTLSVENRPGDSIARDPGFTS